MKGDKDRKKVRKEAENFYERKGAYSLSLESLGFLLSVLAPSSPFVKLFLLPLSHSFLSFLLFLIFLVTRNRALY